MPAVQIHGAEYSLRRIFSDEFSFSIPNYQRPYSWGEEQAGELLEDLLASIGSGSTVEELEPYFLGNIVLIKSDQSPDAEVVDGQQRLTTLTILLAALADVLPPEAGQDVQPFLVQKANAIAGTEARYRLDLRDRDVDFFRRYVQQTGGLNELSALNAMSLSDPQRNIRSNALLLRGRLQKRDPEEVQRLATFLVQRTYLVVVWTPDLHSAYRIFSVLNERGLDLTAADIFKARILGRVPDAQQEKYTKLWEDAEESLGRDRFSELFSHIRMLFARTKQRETIIKEFDSAVFAEVRPGVEFIDEVLLPNASAFETVVTKGYVSESHAAQVNEMLGWLSRLDNSDWIPPAVDWLARKGQNEEQVLAFLRDLERLAASMHVRRVDLTRRIERYGRLLATMKRSGDVFAPDSPLQVSGQECADTLNALNGDLYLSTRVRQYVLLRLDSALSSGGASYDYPIVSIEHVLPQNPDVLSGWDRIFSLGEQERWVHRLANLVLLTRRKNSQASNYDFERKKSLYFAGAGGTSPFVLTSQVLGTQEWTPAVLEARQTVLVQALANLWRLSPA